MRSLKEKDIQVCFRIFFIIEVWKMLHFMITRNWVLFIVMDVVVAASLSCFIDVPSKMKFFSVSVYKFPICFPCRKISWISNNLHLVCKYAEKQFCKSMTQWKIWAALLKCGLWVKGKGQGWGSKVRMKDQGYRVQWGPRVKLRAKGKNNKEYGAWVLQGKRNKFSPQNKQA